MSRKIIYLVNPISGTRAKASLLKLISERTRQQEIPFEILATDPTGEYLQLKKKISAEKITDVVVCGGDGTMNSVASALQGMDIAMGIIPMGSGNGLAFSAKIPPQPGPALDLIFSGKPEYVDAFYINRQFSCMLCGIGFDAAVAHAFAKEKRRGLQTYIKTSLVHFFKARPYPFEIELADQLIRTEAFFISIANSNQFGNNFTIAPKASLHDGLLDIVIVKKMNKLVLPFSMISQVTGINALQKASDYTDRRNILYLQSASLKIRNPGLAPLHIDGEPAVTAAAFDIRLIKNCFRLIQ